MPDQESLAQARGIIYAYLANAFSQEPSEANLATFRLNPEEWHGFLGSPRENPYLEEFLKGEAADLWAAILDFHQLFMVPSDRYVQPYETAYPGDWENPVPRGPQVEDFYRSSGATLKDDFLDLPDHLAAELGFMAYLCRRQAESQNPAETAYFQERQGEFLDRHLLLWAFDLAAKVEELATTSLYRVLARGLTIFLRADRDLLGGDERGVIACDPSPTLVGPVSGGGPDHPGAGGLSPSETS